MPGGRPGAWGERGDGSAGGQGGEGPVQGVSVVSCGGEGSRRARHGQRTETQLADRETGAGEVGGVDPWRANDGKTGW